MLNRLTMPILSLPRLIKRVIVLAVDTSLCIFSVYVAFYLRLGEWVSLFSPSGWRPIWVLGVSITLSLPIFLSFGLYREIFRHSGWSALLTLAKAICLYGVIFFLVFTLVGVEGVPRTIGIIQPLILLIFVGGARAFASYWLSNSYRKQLKLASIPRVLIYGAGEAGRQLAGALSHSYEMQVIGFLDDDKKLHGSSLAGKRIFNPENLLDLADSLNISGILLAIPSASRFRRNEIIKLASDARLSIQTLPSMSDLASGKVSTQDLRSLDIDDLLGREPVSPSLDLVSKNIHEKVVLVTGAGGSIGSELCRQIIEQFPTVLILVDQSEFALYQIHQDLLNRSKRLGISANVRIIPLLASVTNDQHIRSIVREWHPHIIYHAAAYKHVPLVEATQLRV